MELNGKVVVITGASAGIGATLARTLGAQHAHVVLAARRPETLAAVAKESGPEALAVVTDVTRREDVNRLAAAAIARFGRVDVWVNNAGRGISRPPSQLTDEDLDEMFQANVKSVWYGVQAILPHFRERGAGHLVNVSSLLGRVPLAPIRSAYSASKHALNALTACLRAELSSSDPGIAVTLVSPGVVHTEFGANALHGGPDSRAMPGQSAQEVADVLVEAIRSRAVDVYTAPMQQGLVSRYFANIAEAEKTLAPPRPR